MRLPLCSEPISGYPVREKPSRCRTGNIPARANLSVLYPEMPKPKESTPTRRGSAMQERGASCCRCTMSRSQRDVVPVKTISADDALVIGETGRIGAK